MLYTEQGTRIPGEVIVEVKDVARGEGQRSVTTIRARLAHGGSSLLRHVAAQRDVQRSLPRSAELAGTPLDGETRISRRAHLLRCGAGELVEQAELRSCGIEPRLRFVVGPGGSRRRQRLNTPAVMGCGA